ncbi:MAG TPA: hypothetical protein VEC56_00630 [Candidatus Krumholzibacteria bacterium]|nr:hypothetical protein [Candidatus Krumholzibacteria bacterium]
MRYQCTLFLALALAVAACEDDDPAAPIANSASQAYEIKFEQGAANGWFGGDSRPTFSSRTVGNGCSVLIGASIVLESFSFHFERAFYVAPNTGDTGHAVTLMLNVRDATGVILKTVQLDLPSSYSGGWATWTGIDMNVDAGTTLIFTTYLVGAYDSNQVTSGANGDVAAGYAGGVRYTKESTSDAAMEDWADWNEHPWDTWFWLQGTTR